MMIDQVVHPGAGKALSACEMECVSGGKVLENENLYPHKPGGVEVAVYLDGMYMGTATVNPTDPQGPFNPPIPCNR